MKNRKYIFCILVLIVTTFFIGCSSSIEIELLKDGSVNYSFSGQTGKGLENLIRTSQNISSDVPIFYAEGIQKDLSQNGFSNVEVSSKNTELKIKMSEKNKNSMFFTSGVLTSQNGKLKLCLSEKTLNNFYNQCDAEIALYMDMLLSPVFNGEQMTQNEYLELVKSFYGAQVANDLEKAYIKVSLKNVDGSVSKHNISLTQILTLNKSLQLE